MSHTYRYGNKEHTQIVRDDGGMVEVERHRSLVDMPGHFAEQFRLDGGEVAPFKKSHVGDELPPVSEPVGFVGVAPFGPARKIKKLTRASAKRHGLGLLSSSPFDEKPKKAKGKKK